MSNCKEKIKAEIMELWKQRKSAKIEKRIEELLSRYKITANEVSEKRGFSRLIPAFINSKRVDRLSEKSLKNYTYTLNRFASRLPDAYSVEDVTTDDIRQFISYLLTEKKVKNSTLASNIGTLKSFFLWLTVEDVIVKNPMVKIKSVKIDKKRDRKSLTMEELEILRNTCETPREKALVEFLVKTGCRLDEVLKLDINDINFQERSVKVIGKGDKERTVFFSVKAKLLVEDYIRQRKGDSTALFTKDIKPYDAIKGGSVQHSLRSLGVRAGIAKNMHPHLLRHTCATLLVNSGMDIMYIQHLMGHSDPATTQIYAFLDDSSLKREFDKYNCH